MGIMTNSEAIQGLERLYGKIEQICYAEKRQLEAYDSIDIAVHCIEENTKLKAEIERIKNESHRRSDMFLQEIKQLEAELEQLSKQYSNVESMYHKYYSLYKKGQVEE